MGCGTSTPVAGKSAGERTDTGIHQATTAAAAQRAPPPTDPPTSPLPSNVSARPIHQVSEPPLTQSAATEPAWTDEQPSNVVPSPTVGATSLAGIAAVEPPFWASPVPAPVTPAGTIYVLECPGGSDKGLDGHRRDTLPICDALVRRGWAAEPVMYTDEQSDAVRKKLELSQGVIVRVAPGDYDGVSEGKLGALLSSLGTRCLPHPDVEAAFGAKEALFRVKGLSCGLRDTRVYHDAASLHAGFPESLATGPRVLKQNMGCQGEGVWVVRVKDGGGDEARAVAAESVVMVQEAFDNHKEELSLAEFLFNCEELIEGEGGHLLDQRFLPGILSDGELRINMVHTQPISIVRKKPTEGGISATLASGAHYTSHPPDDPQFGAMLGGFSKDVGALMGALGMDAHPLPLLWTADLIADANGEYFLCDLSASCVRVAQQVEMIADAAIKVLTALSNGKGVS